MTTAMKKQQHNDNNDDDICDNNDDDAEDTLLTELNQVFLDQLPSLGEIDHQLLQSRH
jgi:hypothetical protein